MTDDPAYVDIDNAVLGIPYGHTHIHVTRFAACALYSLARIAGDADNTKFWQTAMLMDEVAFWVS